MYNICDINLELNLKWRCSSKKYRSQRPSFPEWWHIIPCRHPYTKFDYPTMCSCWNMNANINLNVSRSSEKSRLSWHSWCIHILNLMILPCIVAKIRTRKLQCLECGSMPGVQQFVLYHLYWGELLIKKSVIESLLILLGKTNMQHFINLIKLNQ